MGVYDGYHSTCTEYFELKLIDFFYSSVFLINQLQLKTANCSFKRPILYSDHDFIISRPDEL